METVFVIFVLVIHIYDIWNHSMRSFDELIPYFYLYSFQRPKEYFINSKKYPCTSISHRRSLNLF